MAKVQFYVIDEDGYVSWFADEKDDSNSGPESFDTLHEAEDRAEELAKAAPGETITICKAVSLVYCEVSDPGIEPLVE